MADDFSKGLELIFGDAVENLRFLKQQQWVVTRNALTAYGALFAVAAVIKANGDDKVLFHFAVLTVLLFNFLVLKSIHAALAKFRNRVQGIYERMPPADDAKGLVLVPNPKSFFDTEGYTWCLVFVSAVGAALAWLAVVRL